ncbi:Ankyrin repeat and KH domain-containing protein 1 [Hondaea fermentalgiana]|uniref:Ankyrin repeat and KH domain-containing protein 1 n=1 Tax=Hondaea fermentalgiana TaxID=2315210 RepID=A0A2R5GZV1_9STRA|nr:Ankyrin repeat and KH domain-containing protein 1 [Hondaea fermentalgiana]|eukprot:GBG33584.1 Ankyrin repeat and KH domain-containing protein 1 [Hondaea fermentalgiana]
MDAAISSGRLELVEASFNEDNERVNTPDAHENTTPLMYALDHDDEHIEIVRWLIEHGANVNAQDVNGWTALMIASQYGFYDAVEVFVRAAAQKGDSSVIEILLRTREDWRAHLTNDDILNIVNREDLALRQGWISLPNRLTNEDVISLLPITEWDLSDQDDDGSTALMHACQYGHTIAARQVLGRNVATLRNTDGWTALMYACDDGFAETVRMLVESGFDIGLDVQENEGFSAAMLACQKPNEAVTETSLLECVKICWMAGANLALRNNDGKDAHRIASDAGRTDAVAFIQFARGVEVLDFLFSSRVIGGMQGPLIHGPGYNRLGLRRNAVQLYDEGIVTLQDCEQLDRGALDRLASLF